jgi:hypothetical protein
MYLKRPALFSCYGLCGFYFEIELYFLDTILTQTLYSAI